MDPVTLGVSAGIGALGIGSNLWSNYLNLQSQADANRTSIDLAKNAVKYRTEDLQRSGLNPILAAGSAMNLPSIKAGQIDTDWMGKGLAGAQQALELATTQAQKKLLDMQADKIKAETIGQEINNTYAADLAKNRIEQIGLSNAFNKLANPTRLSQLAENLRTTDLDQANKILDSKIKEANLPILAIQRIREQLAEQLDNLKIDEKGKDLIAKELLIQMSQKQNDWAQYQNDWYKSRGYVPGFNPSPVNRGIDTLQNLLDTLGGVK